MNLLYRHYFLPCKGSFHGIPLPRPSRVGIDGSLELIATENRRAVFACPYCGHVFAYYGRDVRDTLARTLDPFLGGECRLVSVEVECDGKNCEAQKVIHTVQDAALGTWIGKVYPKDWKFDDSAKCEAGHTLRFDEVQTLHVATISDSPF